MLKFTLPRNSSHFLATTFYQITFPGNNLTSFHFSPFLSSLEDSIQTHYSNTTFRTPIFKYCTQHLESQYQCHQQHHYPRILNKLSNHQYQQTMSKIKDHKGTKLTKANKVNQQNLTRNHST